MESRLGRDTLMKLQYNHYKQLKSFAAVKMCRTEVSFRITLFELFIDFLANIRWCDVVLTEVIGLLVSVVQDQTLTLQTRVQLLDKKSRYDSLKF